MFHGIKSSPRHRGRYAGKPVKHPDTMANTEANYETQPRWVRERRYSIHGVDHMETGRFDRDPVPDFDQLCRSYCETLYGMDENIGRLLDYLEKSGLAGNTLMLYMADNGFELGEHGFYDLVTDPAERHNLIHVPAYQDQISALRQQLFDELEASGGLQIPVLRPAGERLDDRKLPR